MDYFKGKPTADMSREELLAALKEMNRLYQDALGEQVMLFNEVCRRTNITKQSVDWSDFLRPWR